MRDSPKHLLLTSSNSVKKALQLFRAFRVDKPKHSTRLKSMILTTTEKKRWRPLADAGVETPGELVTRIERTNFMDLQIVQRHEHLRAQSAVVRVARAQKQGAQELEDKVV